MEEGDNIRDAMYEDVDMIDVEEGEFVESNSQNFISAGDINEPNQQTHSENSKCGASKKKKKKKNKRKRKGSGSGSGSNGMNIDRFVLDTCRRLKEKKSYMVYTAAGCLGISALSDIIKEVYAVQACGGQKTADGRRFRNGGGILWNIIKVRDPNAYKEIMKKAKEFEKQFRKPNVNQLNVAKKEDSSEGVAFSFAGSDQGNVSDSAFLASEMQNQHEPVTSKEKSTSVHDRLRIPVSYDDDLLGENPVNDAT
ncbi:hypothetical protein L195_g016579 [Trifolium pratense]|uniref:Phosphorylated adapter RNA export protein n=2 Tax=Trifolium pratense TaxID=57577 RepID=A0A2K3MRJ6_TRIPR|nr:hypothetical protein L195_g016579 [Trifolium pratense]